MIVRNLWLLVVLLVLSRLAITEASNENRWTADKDEHKVVTRTFDPNLKKMKYREYELASGKNSVDDSQDTKQLSLNVVPAKFNGVPYEDRRGNVYEWNGHEATRYRRNVTVSDELKNAKKNYKKVKLTRTQSGFKTWKNKNGVKYLEEDTTKKRISRRHANDLVTGDGGESAASKSKRHIGTRNRKDDKSDYYAQRKAVMERFYARQKEIAEKYARKTSTTPKYIYTYDLDPNTATSKSSWGSKIEGVAYATNSVHNGTNSDLHASTSTTTKIPRPMTESTTTKIDYSKQVQLLDRSAEANNEEDVSDDYDYYTLDDNKPASTSISENSDNAVLNDDQWTEDDSKSETLKWGNCAGNLVYQHNLILNVRNASYIETDLTAYLEGSFCVTCIRALPANKTKASVSFNVSRRGDGTFNFVKLTIKGSQNEELFYIIKIWAVGKTDSRCNNV